MSVVNSREPIKDPTINDSLNHRESPSFFLKDRVKKGVYSYIRVRFDTILEAKGKLWSEVYHAVGISKHYASQIRNGHIIPPVALRIKIAEAIGTDTSVIWNSEFWSLYKLEDEE